MKLLMVDIELYVVYMRVIHMLLVYFSVFIILYIFYIFLNPFLICAAGVPNLRPALPMGP